MSKVFVSYKYWDSGVQSLPSVFGVTKVRDYVDYIEKYILKYPNYIYKGESDDEDLSYKSDDYIWEHLKDRIYDSSVTIVIISPNMKERNKWQKSQWIPWEISYSLKEMPRNDRISRSNAILAVVLPDKFGKYDYYDKNELFPILRSNIDIGYVPVVVWERFKHSPDYYINQAVNCKKTTPAYKVVKGL